MPSHQRIDSFDGLRTLAVACVVITHYASADSVLRKLGIGWAIIGVQIFFVLSGFLITKLLIEKYFERESFCGGFAAFLIARTCRIVPLAYVVVGIVAIFSSEALPPHFVRDNLLFVSNLYTVRTGLWYPYLGHYWSLAVEMQFYLLFPLFVWLFRRCLARALVIAMLVLLIAQTIIVTYGGYADPRCLLPIRADAFLWGGLLYCLSQTREFVRTTHILMIVGGILFIGESIVITVTGSIPLRSQMTVGNVLFAGIVGAAMQSDGRFSRFLCTPVLRHLGKISFGIYIWHPVMWLVWARVRDLAGGLPYKLLDLMPLWAVLTLATVVFAEVSWFVLEVPANRLGHRMAGKMLKAGREREARRPVGGGQQADRLVLAEQEVNN
jgi:peptidoglycan/LPS O-acetylase OafA/YrhL